MNNSKALLRGVALLVLLSGVAGQAEANTAGGATIHNAATLTFNGGTNVAAVDVSVLTVAAMPTAVVTTANQTVPSYGTANYTVKLTSNSNGADVLKLALASTDSNTTGAPTLTFLLNGSPVTSVSLGASVTSVASQAGVVFIPAGSQGNLATGETIVVSGNLYTVSSITAGTISTTVNGVTTAEVPTSVGLTPVGSSPAITAGLIPAGTQIGQQVVLTEQVVATAPTSATVTATHTVNFTATTTDTDLNGNPVVYSSASNHTSTVTTVILSTTSLTKYVRNVTRSTSNANGTGGVSCGTSNVYFAAGVTAKSTDTLEYCLMATVATGQPAMTGAVLKDPLPQYTTYVASTTSLNGASVADVNGTTPVNSSSGLTLKSPSATSAGQIMPGESAIVIFQVTVQ